jgi:large subunit ribosomal protein L10
MKQMQMDSLKDVFKDVRDLVLLNVVGLDAITENKMRLDLRKKGIRLQMVKNSLARRVFGDLGLKINTGWEGSTTVAWGSSSIAKLSQEMDTLIKKHTKFMKAKIAVADGEEVAFDVATKLPTREEAIGELLGLMMAPHASLMGALQGPGGQIAGQLLAIEEKKKDEAAPAPSA